MNRNDQHGAALILALMILSFLAVLGGALLTSTTIDIWIADNYKTRMQALYLAESGIEQARETLRTSGPSNVGNDQISLRSGATPDVFVLTSNAQVGNSKKTIEVTVRKGGFPTDEADPRLNSVKGLERISSAISGNATDVFPAGTAIGNYGSSSQYRVAVVNGDCTFGPGTGFGLLLVRGELRLSGAFQWNGLIAVIGKGVITRDADAAGQIIGGTFTAQLLLSPIAISYEQTDTSSIEKANGWFPYSVVSYREY